MKTKLVGRDCQFSKDSSCSKVKDTVKAQKKDEKHTKQVISKENCFFFGAKQKNFT
tara:strand:- start:363 stop:530 length:168 start_codon:yes stop_codon:yes gene_type:complete